jgi:hypothetical protein
MFLAAVTVSGAELPEPMQEGRHRLVAPGDRGVPGLGRALPEAWYAGPNRTGLPDGGHEIRVESGLAFLNKWLAQ